MTQIQFNLMNFPFAEQLTALFDRYSDDYEYTSEGIFRLVTPPQCPECGTLMDHNGSNSHTKRWLGIVKIGKYSCPECQNNVTELCDFWEDAKREFFGIFGNFCQLLRVNHVSYEVLEKASSYFYPCDKDTIRTRIAAATDKMEIPEIKDIQIVHYDEQHPKAGRSQMYRLTLFDYLSKQIIADELFNSKDMKTVEDFLRRNLDTKRPIFIVTDLSLGYRKLFKNIFKNMVTHQLCLLHLNKLIVSDFSVNTTIAEELIKYRLLNIFYNRRMEIEFLSCLIEEEQEMKKRGGKVYEEWLDEARNLFKNFVHNLEKARRRRSKKNMEMNYYWEAADNFKNLMNEIDSFKIPVRMRLRQIKKDWANLVAFYFVDGAPATNNPLENYYSASLKTHRKNQLDITGIEEQIKLSRLKRWGMFGRPQKTLLEAFFVFIPFRDWK